MRSIIALGVALTLFTSTLPAALAADPPTAGSSAPKSKSQLRAARRYFNEGLRLFEKKEYLKAAAKFEHAYDITEDPVVLFNVGEAYARAGRAEQAIAAYRGYLHGKPTAADRSEVERKIAVLEAALTARTPEATAGGVRRPERAPSLPTLPPIESTRPTEVTPPPPSAEEIAAQAQREKGAGSTLTVVSWVGLGLSVALLATSGVLALAARSRENDIGDRQRFLDATTGRPLDFNTGTTARDYQNLFDEGNTYKDLSLLFLILGGASAVATTTMFIIRGTRGKNTYAGAPGGVPSLAVRGHRMGLSWSF